MRDLETSAVNMICDWPAQSSDISIIENTWSMLKHNVEKRKARTSEKLWTIINEEWNSIPNSYIQTLYKSIPSRIKLIKKNKREHCKYWCENHRQSVFCY